MVGSSDLADNLGNANLMALYTLSLLICSSFARFINSRFLIKTSYQKRIIFLSFYYFLGYVSLFLLLNSIDGENPISKDAAFFLSLIPSFIMGTGCALGEAIILGYLRNFPNNFVSGWSSGTGLAGVTGALMTLIFKLNNIKTKLLYITISPVCLIYLISFIVVSRLKSKYIIII